MPKDHFIRKEFKNVKSDDPYFEGRKYEEPTLCTVCGALYRGGRWTWDKLGKGEEPDYAICPACRRIKDKYPGGVVRLSGSYIKDREEEILNLIRNEAELETKYRPLNRIISIRKDDGEIVIETTYPSMARRLGEAIYRAHKGDLEISFKDGEKFAEILWRRDEGEELED